MQSLNTILSVCHSYKMGQYGLAEFQNRLLTAPVPDNLSKDYLAKLTETDNRIEEMLYCHTAEVAKTYAARLVDGLILETEKEARRLAAAKPYKK